MRTIPSKTEQAWRKYQEQVGDLFNQLGFTVAIEEQVEGVRGRHQVDVTARRVVAGINQLWIIECKLWKDPVPKKDVLTLAAIVADVGADRGLFFSESGFQAGAIRAARGTNLSLTSVGDFNDNVADELAQLRIHGLDKRAAVLIHKMETAWHGGSSGMQEDLRQRYIGPRGQLGLPDHDVIGTTGVLSMLRQSLESAQYGRLPVMFTPLDHDDDPYGVMTVGHMDGLLRLAEETISICERIYSHMVSDGGDVVTSWKEFQSSEMTEFLERVRKRSD